MLCVCARSSCINRTGHCRLLWCAHLQVPNPAFHHAGLMAGTIAALNAISLDADEKTRKNICRVNGFGWAACAGAHTYNILQVRDEGLGAVWSAGDWPTTCTPAFPRIWRPLHQRPAPPRTLPPACPTPLHQRLQKEQKRDPSIAMAATSAAFAAVNLWQGFKK